MAETDEVTDNVQHLITSVGEQRQAVLDAVKRFVDTVNDALPEGPVSDLRDQVIDSAFSMTTQVLDASNRFVSGLVESAGRTVDELTGDDSEKATGKASTGKASTGKASTGKASTGKGSSKAA